MYDTMYDCTFPADLPESWRPVWDYTFERSYGPQMRETIIEILQRKKIHRYRPGDVLSGDLIDMWAWYKSYVVCFRVCTLSDTIVAE